MKCPGERDVHLPFGSLSTSRHPAGPGVTAAALEGGARARSDAPRPRLPAPTPVSPRRLPRPSFLLVPAFPSSHAPLCIFVKLATPLSDYSSGRNVTWEDVPLCSVHCKLLHSCLSAVRPYYTAASGRSAYLCPRCSAADLARRRRSVRRGNGV